MLSSIRFLNFKALRDATLPLSQFTLIVGPNGSGKSTALQALRLVAFQEGFSFERIQSLDAAALPSVEINWSNGAAIRATFQSGGNFSRSYERAGIGSGTNPDQLTHQLGKCRFYAFDPDQIAAPVPLTPNAELRSTGANLVAVLDRLRDLDPERFEKLNEDLATWLPEFDRILFETPGGGQRELLLRVAGSKKGIKGSELSHGTLFTLALLTLANSISPPPFIAIEEPDRGVHPRMLRRVQDALNRLAFPLDYGDRREPVQVVATTHSPFLLDLYRDQPEQIVIAEKKQNGAEFTKLVDKADVNELLGESRLGDLWYSGVFGGVPSEA
jgi:predicted ATPase